MSLLNQDIYDWGNDVEPGWKHLVEPLVSECKKRGVKIAQVKEKFGTLRFYTYGHEDEELSKLIREAEKKSAVTCEFCGKPGTLDDSGGWWKTTCPDHTYEKRKATMK